MRTVLLREYIGLVIEKIRSEKPHKSDKKRYGAKFNLKAFKEITDPEKQIRYASAFLESLGVGSSRQAFLLSSRYALKIALNKEGLAQNKGEIEVYSNPSAKPLVAKIYDAADNDTWLVSDLVKPITDTGEFEKLAGTDWGTFRECMIKANETQEVDKRWPDLVKKVADVMLKTQLKVGDLVGQGKMSHWGKTPDGRVVLLDYGVTKQVWNAHYEQDWQKRHGKPAGHGDATVVPNGDTDKDAPKKPGQGSNDDASTVKPGFGPAKKQDRGTYGVTKKAGRPEPEEDDLERTKR